MRRQAQRWVKLLEDARSRYSWGHFGEKQAVSRDVERINRTVRPPVAVGVVVRPGGYRRVVLEGDALLDLQPAEEYVEIGRNGHIVVAPGNLLYPSEPAEEEEKVTWPYAHFAQVTLSGSHLAEYGLPPIYTRDVPRIQIGIEVRAPGGGETFLC